MAKTKKTKKSTSERYNLGSFVTSNQSKITRALNSAAQTTGSGILSGASTGATIGSFLPGPGTLIGAGVGALGGLIGNIFGKKSERELKRKEEEAARMLQYGQVSDDYLSNINISNEDALGVYENGGDVFPNIINIEKGELQIDPNTGKILREYKGINPETGGLYKEHNEKGKDSENNFVNAEEGSFIITKDTASKYKKAIENNDKLTQETIMQNIRNKKKKLGTKYADGDLVRKGINPIFPTADLGINNPRFTGPSPVFGTPNTEAAVTGYQAPIDEGLSIDALNNLNTVPEGTEENNHWLNALSLGTQLMPGFSNILQGSRSPNYMDHNRVGLNVGNRQRVLSSMPREVSTNPALSTIRGQQYNRSREISRTTGDPNVSRALRTAGSTEAVRASNEAYYNTELMNNQIRNQNASLINALNESDTRREMFNLQNMNQINQINRQIETAKRHQLNLGLSQTGRAIQDRVTARKKETMNNKMLDVMKEIFPEGEFLFDQWRTNKGGNR